MLSHSAVTTMLPVIDMVRARAFYEECLGLEPGALRPDGKFVYQVGGSALALFPKPGGTKAEHTAKDSNDYFRYTSAMNEQFTQSQKIQVVEHMWQVAYADGHLDANENHVISKVAGLLHVTHGEYIGAKLHAKQAAGL